MWCLYNIYEIVSSKLWENLRTANSRFSAAATETNRKYSRHSAFTAFSSSIGQRRPRQVAAHVDNTAVATAIAPFGTSCVINSARANYSTLPRVPHPAPPHRASNPGIIAWIMMPPFCLVRLLLWSSATPLIVVEGEAMQFCTIHSQSELVPTPRTAAGLNVSELIFRLPPSPVLNAGITMCTLTRTPSPLSRCSNLKDINMIANENISAGRLKYDGEGTARYIQSSNQPNDGTL